MNLWNSFFGKLVMTFLISMVPVVELRGAIPIAVAHGLPFCLRLAAHKEPLAREPRIAA